MTIKTTVSLKKCWSKIIQFQFFVQKERPLRTAAMFEQKAKILNFIVHRVTGI